MAEPGTTHPLKQTNTHARHLNIGRFDEFNDEIHN